LDEYDIRGIKTTIGFCRGIIASDAFASADFDTTTVDRLLERRRPAKAGEDREADAAAVAAAMWLMRRMPNASAPARSESAWGQRARTDGLR
jgi:propionyl-CoA carboxylase alpha chain